MDPDVFPSLTGSPHLVTSPEDESYNCFAWAVGASDRWWDPFGYYWPLPITGTFGPEDFTLDFVTRAYATLGFSPCESGGPEPGFEKVALYAKEAQATHAAKLLPNGEWTSKLGDLQDITHQLSAIEGPGYGTVQRFLRRPVQSRFPSNISGISGDLSALPSV